mgnify:CR=1 FL=1
MSLLNAVVLPRRQQDACRTTVLRDDHRLPRLYEPLEQLRRLGFELAQGDDPVGNLDLFYGYLLTKFRSNIV